MVAEIRVWCGYVVARVCQWIAFSKEQCNTGECDEEGECYIVMLKISLVSGHR